MKKLKSIISIFLAALMICTVLIGTDMPAKAAFVTDVQIYTARGYAIRSDIENAPAGSEVDVFRKDGDDFPEDGVVFRTPVVIKKDNITVNFKETVSIYGAFRSEGFKGNRIFLIEGNNVTLNLENVRFTNMCRSEDDGGAIYITGKNCVINGGVFDNCFSSDNNGGAIYIAGDNARIVGAQFIGGNYPADEDDITNKGGAIYVKGKNASIENCSFRNCATTNQGGAIYSNGDFTKIDNCSFTNCESRKEGGAIYLNQKKALVTNSSFSGCRSKTNDAGAIFVCHDDVTIQNSRFENCRAIGSGSDGGAIKLSYGNYHRLLIEGCTFKNCFAQGDGHWVDGGNSTAIVHCTKPYNTTNYCNSLVPRDVDCSAGTLNKIANDLPNCTQDGVLPYWECSCGNLFSGSPPSASNRISNLATWMTGAGKADALGHDFECITDADTYTLTLQCKNNPSHRTTLTLLEKDSTYPGNTNKTWQDVVSGDTESEIWKALEANDKWNCDVRYYVNVGGDNWELTTITNSGAEPPNPGDKGYPPRNAGSYKLVGTVTQRDTEGTEREVAWVERPFTIHPKRITSQMITLDPVSVINNGTNQTVFVTVKDGDYTLTNNDYEVTGGTWVGTHYTVTESGVGTHVVSVTGKGNYTTGVGTINVNWSITSAPPLRLESGSLSASLITYEGDLSGSQITRSADFKVMSGDEDLTESGTLDWENSAIVPDKVGRATYNVVFTPALPAHLEAYGILKIPVTVDVRPKDISSEVTIHTPDTYTGNDLINYISVTYQGEPLVKNTDYVVTTNPSTVKEPGRYTATIEFRGNYTGTATTEFTVYRDLQEDDLTFEVNDDYESDDAGDAIIIKLDSKTLVRGVDYEITGTLDESKAPIEYRYPATITFDGVGLYRGSITKTFIVTYPEPEPTPEPGPEPEPTPDPEPTPQAFGGTIEDGLGSGRTEIGVFVIDGFALIDDIPESTIESVANASSDPFFVIDLSKVETDGRDITSVILLKSTAEAIERAIQSPDNEKNSLMIKTKTAIIKLNAAALTSITSQATGEDILLVVEYKEEEQLNDNQRSVIRQFNDANGKSVDGIFEVYIESDGTRITSFEGGEIIIGKADFSIPDGKSAEHYFVYYLPEGGQAVLHSTWVENGIIYFRTSHLSDYAIVYDENITNDTANPTNVLYTLRSPATGEWDVSE